MPFTRSRTKSGQANGVAPNAPASNAPRFFPPSHFAAAGNIRSPSRTEDQSFSGTRAVIPTSTLPHLPASPSSSSADPAAASSSRLGQLTRKLSLTRNGSSGAPLSAPKTTGKRQSSKAEHWKGEVPELEANLLPSLRDTIDRMTHPPSPNRASRSKQVFTPSEPGTSALGGRYQYQPSEMSPQRTFTPRDGSRLPTPKSSRLPAPALKSALKTPIAPSAATSPYRSPGKTARFGNGPGPNGRGPSSIPLRQATSAVRVSTASFGYCISLLCSLPPTSLNIAAIAQILDRHLFILSRGSPRVYPRRLSHRPMQHHCTRLVSLRMPPPQAGNGRPLRGAVLS